MTTKTKAADVKKESSSKPKGIAIFFSHAPKFRLLVRPEEYVMQKDGTVITIPARSVQFRSIKGSAGLRLDGIRGGIARSWCLARTIQDVCNDHSREGLKRIVELPGHGTNFIYIGPNDERQALFVQPTSRDAPRPLKGADQDDGPPVYLE
jgi:hypothetical protein